MPRKPSASNDLSPAGKDLLLAVLRLELAPGHAAETPVSAGDLAKLLKLAPSSITEGLQRAAKEGLLAYRPRHGANLTSQGRILALRLLRRHRLIETFLQRTLGFDWSEVHAEAERLEIQASEIFVDRVDRLLGHPTTDPHGDPIPSADGRLAKPEGQPLTDFPDASRLRLLRVLGNDPEFLQLLGRHGLTPGQSFSVTSVDVAAGIVRVARHRGTALTLSTGAAQRLIAMPSEPT